MAAINFEAESLNQQVTFMPNNLLTRTVKAEFISYTDLAHRDAISRLLQAFIKEKFVKFIYANKTLIVFLENTQKVLLIENVCQMSLARYKINNDVFL